MTLSVAANPFQSVNPVQGDAAAAPVLPVLPVAQVGAAAAATPELPPTPVTVPVAAAAAGVSTLELRCTTAADEKTAAIWKKVRIASREGEQLLRLEQDDAAALVAGAGIAKEPAALLTKYVEAEHAALGQRLAKEIGDVVAGEPSDKSFIEARRIRQYVALDAEKVTLQVKEWASLYGRVSEALSEIPEDNTEPLVVEVRQKIGQLPPAEFAELYKRAAAAVEALNPSNEADAQKNYGFVCRGRLMVRPAVDDGDKLVGWEVWVQNTGATPFASTASFVRSNKNAGFGLQSMGVPRQGDAALQFIWAHEDYGVKPVPGEVVRIGVRGYGTFEVGLPAVGETVSIKVSRMKLETNGGGRANAEYFTERYVTNRRDEKMGTKQVKAFQAGKPLNDPFKRAADYPF